MIRDNTVKLLRHFKHNNTWLLSKWSPELETQIYVTPGTKEETHPTKNDCWSNGVHTWKHIRWPYNASTKPEFKDFTPNFPLAEYVESIGTTWWNWEKQESMGCVFDFDSIIGHHQSGLSHDELKNIVDRLAALDYVTIIHSTSGNGYHVLVFFAEGHRPHTRNHAEHTLVAEAVLQKMSEDAKFDLAEKVDCYGMIGWFWSTRATEENGGFSMVKQAERDLSKDEIADWTQIPAKRMKMRPKVVVYDEDGQELPGNNIIGHTDETVVLDKDHMKIIRALENSGWSFNYVEEHNLFHTHTAALRLVHRKLGLKGPFATVASGKGDEKANCFIRPANGGGFSVFRFGKGTPEHNLWDQTTPTTWCTYNQSVPYHKVLTRMGAEWIGEQKHYEFESKEELVEATDVLGNRVPLKLIDNRHYALAVNGRGCVLKCFCETDEKPAECDGWQRVRGHHKKVLSRLEDIDVSSMLNHVDQVVRYVVRNGNALGWAIKTESGWIQCKADDAKRLAKFHVGAQESELYLGAAIKNPWTLVNIPFEREHMEGRKWNLGSAQLKVPCATEPGPHPHWDIMLKHIGQSWNEPLKDDPDMQKYGICTGADYLRAWIACMIRYPDDPLPYIFLVGPQNTGKSLCHEVLRESMLNGVVHGGNALSSGSGFNGEFEGKVLAAIDETDLSKAPGLAARLKAWTNATHIQIHKKGQQPYDVRNYMKFLQTANNFTALIIEHGDTRIVVGEVLRFKGKEIPKPIFIRECLKELPYFLYTLGTMQLPPMTGRTRLPVIETEVKSEILQSTEPDSLTFIKAVFHPVSGYYVKLTDAYEKYVQWCRAENKKPVKPGDFKLEIGLRYPVHQGPVGRAFTIGNISLNPNAEPKKAFLMEGKDGRHERCN